MLKPAVIKKFLYKAIKLACLIVLTVSVSAFKLETYTDQSVLSEGKWLKIGIEETGIDRKSVV